MKKPSTSLLTGRVPGSEPCGLGRLVAAGRRRIHRHRVFAYSAGPYPLSTHGWGEVGVVFFFGLIPVNFTYYVQTLQWDAGVMLSSLAIGLMGANVLIVNNYRDVEDDRRVCKRTLCVRFGRRAMLMLYAADAVAGAAMLMPLLPRIGYVYLCVPAFYLAGCMAVIRNMTRREEQPSPPCSAPHPCSCSACHCCR